MSGDTTYRKNSGPPSGAASLLFRLSLHERVLRLSNSFETISQDCYCERLCEIIQEEDVSYADSTATSIARPNAWVATVVHFLGK